MSRLKQSFLTLKNIKLKQHYTNKTLIKKIVCLSPPAPVCLARTEAAVSRFMRWISTHARVLRALKVSTVKRVSEQYMYLF